MMWVEKLFQLGSRPPSPRGASLRPDTVAAASLKILSYNIHKGFTAGNRRFVLKRMREVLEITNADLDACHGRVGPVRIDGRLVTTYHYRFTLEFPYTIGCFRGTPLALPHRGPPPPF